MEGSLYSPYIDNLGHTALEEHRLLIVEVAVPDPDIVVAFRCIEAEAAAPADPNIAAIQVHCKGAAPWIIYGHSTLPDMDAPPVAVAVSTGVYGYSDEGCAAGLSSGPLQFLWADRRRWQEMC